MTDEHRQPSYTTSAQTKNPIRIVLQQDDSSTHRCKGTSEHGACVRPLVVIRPHVLLVTMNQAAQICFNINSSP